MDEKDREIVQLKKEIVAYEERLETALSHTSQIKKENIHIVENHENLKRMYKELFASEELKLKPKDNEEKEGEEERKDDNNCNKTIIEIAMNTIGPKLWTRKRK